MPSDQISLRCEPCPICNKHPPMIFPRDQFNTGLTGLATIIDIHGLAYSPPHIRILYVDEQGSVRSFKAISEITGDEKILSELKKLTGMYTEESKKTIKK